MVRALLFILLVLLSGAAAQAQVVLANANDEGISTKVVEATPSDTLRAPAAGAFPGRYATGARQVPPLLEKAASRPNDNRLDTLSAAERQQLGRAHARQFYRGRTVFWGSAGATFYLSPLFGLGSTAFIASRPVAPRNLAAPVPTLLEDPDYRVGYQQQAHRLKRGKAWAGYGTGTVALIGVLFAAIVIDLQR